MIWRYVAGGIAAMCLIAAGVVFFNSGARSKSPLGSAPVAAAVDVDQELPDAAPEASARTREQKRFDRYDKDRDGAVTREEYLASRRKAYAKLDLNHDGALSFDEWAAKSTGKFALADADKSGTMTAKEFATTAPKRRMATRAKCPPAGAPRDEES